MKVEVLLCSSIAAAFLRSIQYVPTQFQPLKIMALLRYIWPQKKRSTSDIASNLEGPSKRETQVTNGYHLQEEVHTWYL